MFKTHLLNKLRIDRLVPFGLFIVGVVFLLMSFVFAISTLQTVIFSGGDEGVTLLIDEKAIKDAATLINEQMIL